LDILTYVSAIAYTKQVKVRISRHARNKLRLYKLSAAGIEQAIESGEKVIRGEKIESRQGELRVIWLTTGSYALVVTIIRTR
jgi:hypothetical protein